jgi:hypothetical protein
MPRPDRTTSLASGPRIIVAEEGLGPALVHYLFRSDVAGEVCVAEWPAASPLDDAPVRRWILRVTDPPHRMQRLLQSTPGVTCFVGAAAGVAVETGFRHPVELRACPVFDPEGLVLLRGRGSDPWVVDRLPAMAELGVFARIEWRLGASESVGRVVSEPEPVRVRMRLAPSAHPLRNVTATWVPLDQMPLLRRLAYSLPYPTLAKIEIAVTAVGAILRCPEGIDGIPVGLFFVEVHPQLYIPAGYDVTPAIGPDVLARTIGAAASQVVFILHSERVFAVDRDAFGPFDATLLDAPPLESLAASAVAAALDESPLDLAVTSIGMMPLRGVQPPPSR